MAYGNNFNSNKPFNGYARGNYNRPNYGVPMQYAPQGGQYQPRRGNYTAVFDPQTGQTKMVKKLSGCKFHQTTKGKRPAISAWKFSKRHGFMKIIASPKVNGKGAGEVFTSRKGTEYVLWVVSVTNTTTGAKSTHSGLHATSKGKLYIPDLGLVASYNAANGGFFGRSKKV